uniref:Integrase catalytic domain-containing protein n=1 Tax=Trichuris muris TaxID=70415 RepID=A0A5S6QR89_TRIMR
MATVIARDLSLDVDKVTFWTDSQVVLHWVKSTKQRFCTFVENRITEILDVSQANQWRFVPGRENPADVLSRGTTVRRLKDSLWFSGPLFLVNSSPAWPTEPTGISNVSTEELELVCSARYTSAHEVPSKDVILQLIDRTSQLRSLLRVVARVHRAVALFRSSTDSLPVEVITAMELVHAWTTCVKSVQRHYFAFEVSSLGRSQPLSRTSKLCALNPFMDDNGVLRVGGRLHLAHLPFEARHPPVLPSKHSLADLLVQQAHSERGHSGVEDTLAEVRGRAWIIDLRALVRRVLYQCVTCRREIGIPSKTKLSWLPPCRIRRPLHVFASTGLDYFGPFYVSIRRSTVKRWICLFTCLAVRAVHMEICHNLDADSFLSAFRRFTARRGTPAECISDNGTNFVAGDRILREGIKRLNNSKVEEFMAAKGIRWHFIPPGAPNFGGSWERLIRCAKRAMATVFRGRSTNDEILQTVVVEVEDLLNGRPLTHVSSDVRDTEPLTPNHFLLGRPYASLPPTWSEERETVSRKRWQAAQTLTDQFWRRWIREYLPTLASSSRNKSATKDLREDDIVLLVEVDNPRGIWPLGQIKKSYPGPDGVTRVVDVQCSRGVIRRPVSRLIKLTSTVSDVGEAAGEDVVA